MKRALLINWDNYPHVTSGGVYTWAKSLVDNMPDWEFLVLNQLSNPNAGEAGALPPNVRRVIPIPMFGTYRMEEYTPNGPFVQRARRTTDSVIERQFLPRYQGLLRLLLADIPEPKGLARAVADLHGFLTDYDAKKCFEDPRTWLAFSRLIQADPLYGGMRLKEALLNFQVVQRSLQVLSVQIPKVDLIHSSLAWLPALAGVSAKMKNGCSLIVTEHGVAFRELLLYYNLFLDNEVSKVFWTVFTRNVVRVIYSEADVVIPVCHANAEWEARLGADPSKIRVIHNGVDTARFRPLPQPRTGRDGGRPTVVSVSRISVFKDIVALIQATGYVRRAIPNVLCLVFGSSTEPEYAAMCQATIKRLELSECFRLMGPTKEPEKAYAMADVVAFGSITEAFPFAVIEAMACQRAVVSTDVGGVRESLEGCGLLVRSRRPRELADAIIRLLRDEGLRSSLASAGLARARREFSLERSVRRYRDLYEEVTSGPGEGRERAVGPRPVVSR
ncbi:MAG: GT4 family glycosyltransferase PelF [Nitrososphaerales archaeon]